ncbi:hypothetical protein SUDANB126_06189 [Streptomyces sp. enrichment culture]
MRATGEEDFVTVAQGEETVEHPGAGEVVRRDDAGVTRRRWNRRQGPRTRLAGGRPRVSSCLEGLAPVPLAEVEDAAAGLVGPPEGFSPGARITAHPTA